jgi:hypothetical protein
MDSAPTSGYLRLMMILRDNPVGHHCFGGAAVNRTVASVV